MASVDLAVLGNGMFGALVDGYGRFVWCCMDTFDGDPVFNCLLNNNSDKTGFYDVVLEDFERAEQCYLGTSTVLVTTLHSSKGDSVELRDVAPRFLHYERLFRPFQLIRTVRRLQGEPRVSIRIRPTFQYNSTDGYQTRGSQHVRFCGPTHTWRVTTNASIRHILEEMPLLVPTEPVHIIFGSDESLTSSLQQVASDFESRTVSYWEHWCCSLNLPAEFQEVLVRAAMTVAVMQVEDCGGFLSALTLGLPLGPSGGATRDTRVCRLLDECLALPVLRDIGLFDVARKFLIFVKEICFHQGSPQHAYNAWGSTQERKREWAPYLAGYRGMAEVHSGGPLLEPWLAGPGSASSPGPGSGASEAGVPEDPVNAADEWQRRTVVYGLLVVTLSHAFFDIRLSGELCSPKLTKKLELYASRACDSFAYVSHLYRADRNGLGDWPASATAAPKGWQRPPCGASFFDDEYAFFSGEADGGPAKEQSNRGDAAGGGCSRLPESQPSVHSLTSVLCWAAADRLRRISAHSLHDAERAEYWQRRAREMHEEICRRAWNPQRGAFTTYWGGSTVGPSMLRLAELGFVHPEDPRFHSTVRAFEADAPLCAVCVSAADGGPITAWDTGKWRAMGGEAILDASSTCYMTNTLLWYCEALRSVGAVAESRRLLEALIGCATHHGILTEAVDLQSAELWGNVPSLAALLSLLRVAPRLSKSWREV